MKTVFEPRWLLLGLALFTLAPPCPAAEKPRQPDPEALEILRARLAAGECPAALARIRELRALFPADPDLKTFEANCRMSAVRRSSRQFDADLYERTRIGLGLDSLPMNMASGFEKVVVEFEPQERDAALALFASALAGAPERDDLIVGYVAALMDASLAKQAAGVIRTPGTRPSLDALPALTQIVKDHLQLGHLAEAAELAEALSALFPDSSPVQATHCSVLVTRQETPRAIPEILKYLSHIDDQVQLREGILVLLLARKWNEAVPLLVPLAANNPEFATWLALARGRVEPRATLPMWNEIDAQLKRLPKPDPRWRAVLDHYLKILKGEKLPTPAMRLRAAQMFGQANLPVPALAEADRAASDDPTFLEARKFMVSLFRELRRFDLALEELDFMAALGERIDPRQTSVTAGEIHLARGQVLYALERDAEAGAALEKAASLGLARPYLQGLAALGAGKREAAIAFFRQEVETRGSDAPSAELKLQQLGGALQETAPASK